MNYKKEFGDGINFFINQAFFITSVKDPIVDAEDMDGKLSFANQSKPVVTRGPTLMYRRRCINRSYILAVHLPVQFMLPPKNRGAFVVAYEATHGWCFELKGSYTGYHHREDFSKMPGYFFTAAMTAKNFWPK